MIIKTNKLVGEFLAKSKCDNLDIRRVSKSELSKLKESQFKQLKKIKSWAN